MISLRIFAECDPSQSAALAARLKQALSAFSAEPASPPKPYWKVPGLIEFDFHLLAADGTVAALRAIAPGGWSVREGDESWGVWNRTPGHEFLAAEVWWAELSLAPA